MTPADELLHLLDIEQLEVDLFRGVGGGGETTTENTILEYLSSYYGPKEGARRPALRADQLPENPYRQTKL